MPSRHRWKFRVCCPACEKGGEIKVTEDAEPPFTEEPRREYASDDGFSVVSHRDVMTIKCEACGTRFPNVS